MKREHHWEIHLSDRHIDRADFERSKRTISRTISNIEREKKKNIKNLLPWKSNFENTVREREKNRSLFFVGSLVSIGIPSSFSRATRHHSSRFFSQARVRTSGNGARSAEKRKTETTVWASNFCAGRDLIHREQPASSSRHQLSTVTHTVEKTSNASGVPSGSKLNSQTGGCGDRPATETDAAISTTPGVSLSLSLSLPFPPSHHYRNFFQLFSKPSTDFSTFHRYLFPSPFLLSPVSSSLLREKSFPTKSILFFIARIRFFHSSGTNRFVRKIFQGISFTRMYVM